MVVDIATVDGVGFDEACEKGGGLGSGIGGLVGIAWFVGVGGGVVGGDGYGGDAGEVEEWE